MNNQDFKKLLRENIEARKEKELEEGLWDSAMDKIGDWATNRDSKSIEKASLDNITKGDEDEDEKIILVLRKAIKKDIVDIIIKYNNKNPENKIDQYSQKELNDLSLYYALRAHSSLRKGNPWKDIESSLDTEIYQKLNIEPPSDEKVKQPASEKPAEQSKVSNTLKHNFKDFVKEIGLEYPKMKEIINNKINEMAQEGGASGTNNPFEKENIELYKTIGNRILSQLKELYNSFDLQVENKNCIILDKNTMLFIEGIIKNMKSVKIINNSYLQSR